MLPVAAAADRRRLITALHAHCALKLSTSAAIAAGAKRVSPPAAPLLRAFFYCFHCVCTGAAAIGASKLAANVIQLKALQLSEVNYGTDIDSKIF